MSDSRQFVRYLFLELDPTWRRLSAREQIAHKERFVATIKQFHGRLMVRPYSLVGTRGDADLLLWLLTEDLETLQAVETAVFSTDLGAYLRIAQSYIGMTKRSQYEFPEVAGAELTVEQPSESPYLFVYPMTKKREWYAIPFEQRREIMKDHVATSRKHPGIRINTTYSFGLDDPEFVVAFEGADPAEFLDLVMELRGTPSSAYTETDTPVYTALQMSLWEALDSLGGASVEQRVADAGADGDGFVRVCTIADLPPGGQRRAYIGRDAVALFNVNGTLHAISDRCSHGRASLSEGTVDAATCILECPWHGGRFDLRTGQPAAGPPQAPVKVYRVTVRNDDVLVG